MAWVAIGLAGAWGILGVLARVLMLTRRTGRSPIRGGAGVSGLVAVVAIGTCLVAGPVAELAFGETRLFSGVWVAGLGVAISSAALLGFVWSQSAMGESLRIGVDPAERTRLVTAGPFRFVRNPIYSCMIADVIGVALMVPNAVSFAVIGVLTLGIELHVRRIEEPYLSSVHEGSYGAYAAQVGRFVPGVGRLES